MQEQLVETLDFNPEEHMAELPISPFQKNSLKVLNSEEHMVEQKRRDHLGTICKINQTWSYNTPSRTVRGFVFPG